MTPFTTVSPSIPSLSSLPIRACKNLCFWTLRDLSGRVALSMKLCSLIWCDDEGKAPELELDEKKSQRRQKIKVIMKSKRERLRRRKETTMVGREITRSPDVGLTGKVDRQWQLQVKGITSFMSKSGTSHSSFIFGRQTSDWGHDIIHQRRVV